MKTLNLKLCHGNAVLDHSKAPYVLAKQIKDNWLADDFYVSFLLLSCRGMLSLEKRAVLAVLLHKHQPQLAFLTETRLDTTLENSELSAGGSFSVSGRQHHMQGWHGGTLILQNTSNILCAEFFGNPVISNVDFCTSALIKFDDRLVFFSLVYLPPQLVNMRSPVLPIHPIRCFPVHRNSVLGLTLQMLSMIYLLRTSTLNCT